MRLLYFVFIVSIAALLGAAFAIVRSVRAHTQGAGSAAVDLSEDPTAERAAPPESTVQNPPVQGLTEPTQFGSGKAQKLPEDR